LAGGSVYSYEYNKYGELIKSESSARVSEYVYNSFGNVVEKKDKFTDLPGKVYTTQYEYYTDGEIKKVTNPAGHVVEYSQNHDNQTSSIKLNGQILSGYQYNARGLLSKQILGNGIVQEKQYDAGSMLVSDTIKDGSGTL
jgi:hypothetical protein